MEFALERCTTMSKLFANATNAQRTIGLDQTTITNALDDATDDISYNLRNAHYLTRA